MPQASPSTLAPRPVRDQGGEHEERTEGEQRVAGDGDAEEGVGCVGESVELGGEPEHDQRQAGEGAARQHDRTLSLPMPSAGEPSGHLGGPVHDPGGAGGEHGGHHEGEHARRV